MFGYIIIKKKDYEKLTAELIKTSGYLVEAVEENKRLFDSRNRRLTTPRADANGVMRRRNGEFAEYG